LQDSFLVGNLLLPCWRRKVIIFVFIVLLFSVALLILFFYFMLLIFEVVDAFKFPSKLKRAHLCSPCIQQEGTDPQKPL
jgi:hypothetical protein